MRRAPIPLIANPQTVFGNDLNPRRINHDIQARGLPRLCSLNSVGLVTTLLASKNWHIMDGESWGRGTRGVAKQARESSA